MYKILLVDDEIITLQGIVNFVNWEKFNTQLIGMAKNGLEALDMIKSDVPDIIISDIKMPGLDGLQLLEEVKKTHPTIIFVILSGYSEFEFAKRAMEHGVKHYLLKPCNEDQIEKVLLEATKEVMEQKRYDDQLKTYKDEVEKTLPQTKQQFLKELIMNRLFTRKERKYYENLFHINFKKTRKSLVLFEIHNDYQFETYSSLGKIVNQEFSTQNESILSLFMQSHILFLVPAIPPQELASKLKSIKNKFEKVCNLTLTVSYTKPHLLTDTNQNYKKVKESLNQQFYKGTGTIINADITRFSNEKDNIEFLKVNIIVSLRSEDYQSAYKEIHLFFEKIKEVQFTVDIAKTYILNLYASIASECRIAFEKIVMLEEMKNLNQMKNFIENVVKEYVDNQNREEISKQSKLVLKVKSYVDEYLDNENLSLSWLANEVLFMNADYLGKLFKKETGEKFSQYLLRVRMEKAQEILLASEDTKMQEVGQKVGFLNYPQYFSQVFKKYTNYTPSEYKRSKEQS